jgi:hypothetical protein
MKVLLISLLISIAAFGNAQQFINFNSGEKSNESGIYEVPKRQITASNDNSFGAAFNIKGAKIAEKRHNKETYQFLQINGFGKMAMPGHPALPMTIEHVLMPKGSKPEVKINQVEYRELDGFNIHPALQPAKDTYNAAPPEWEKDEILYGTNAWYPASPVSIKTIQYNRGFPIALVEINPVQYNPVTGKIRVNRNIDYTIQFNGESKSLNELRNNHTAHFTKLLQNKIINKNLIPTGTKARTKSDGKDYIIVTHDEYLAAADTLAMWKRQMGYTVEIVSQPSWTSEQVKEAIHSRYDAWTVKPDYFVIIGDHTGDYAVPGEEFLAPDGGANYASDLYYACMDGYADYHADMAFGRMSVANSEQAMTVVLKTVNYERNPVTDADFYDKGLACAQFQDVEDNESPDGYAARRFCHTSEDIRDYSINQGYTTDRIYYTDEDHTPTNYNNGYYSDGQAIPSDLLRSNGFAWNGDDVDIKNAIEDGRFFVFHRDHGFSGGTGWSHPYFGTSNASSLTNGNLLPVVFSINCHTGEYYQNKCFAEGFTRNPDGGAVGVVAAAYYSYSGYNDGFSAGMIDAIWSDPGLTPNFGSGGAYYPPASSANNIRTMGDVLNQGLTRMQQTWGSSQYTHQLFHYFGDPSMRIWTENPNANIITAAHNNTISCDGNSFIISDCNIEGAKISILQGDELIGTATVSGGSATVDYTFANYYSNAILTITAENCKPYITNLDLSGNCIFPPIVETRNTEPTEYGVIMLSGDIIENAFGTIISSGIAYSTQPDPAVNSENSFIIESNPTIDNGIFEIILDQLSHSTRYFYKAFATNEHGVGEGEIRHFTTNCEAINEFPHTIDFRGELLPACWEASVLTNTSGWQFKNTADHEFQSTTAANGFAVVDGEKYGEEIEDADMITSTFDFSSYGQVELSFEYYFRSTNPRDNGILYYSVDNGNTWTEIQRWIATEGSLSSPAMYSYDFTTELAGMSNVKFKWNYEGNDDYWFIDDIVISASQFSQPQIIYNDEIIENGSPIYDYTNVSVGNSLAYEFKLKNTGDLDINFNNLTIDNPDVSITQQPDSNVPGGDSTSFNITYTPSDTESDSIAIIITSDATLHSEYAITLYANLKNTYAAEFEVINSYGEPVENASINVANYETLQTNSNGIAILQNANVLEIIGYEISHPDYQNYSGNFRIINKDISVKDELTGKMVNLTFNVSNSSGPLSNAMILLENGDYANTSNGTATFEVISMQNISYEITRMSYEDYSGSFDVMNIDASVDVTMEAEGNKVTVNIHSNGSPIEGATVTVNNLHTAVSGADGVAIVTGVPMGMYRSIDVVAPNYLPYSTTTNILSDIELDVELVPKPNADITIMVMHNDNPIEEANIDIDDTYSSITNSSGEALLTEIPFGNRVITITKSGFDIITDNVEIQADTTITYQIQETGIDDNIKNQVLIYPNPTSSGFYIESPEATNSTLTVINSAGITVLTKRIDSNREFIQNKLEKGLYFIKIETSQYQTVQKLLIE